MQVPCASLKIGFRIKKLLHFEIVDFIFTCPLLGRFLAHLHESALSVAAVFSRIEAALAPHDCFYQHRIEMMFGRYGANQAIVLMKSRRTHPLVECVDWIA